MIFIVTENQRGKQFHNGTSKVASELERSRKVSSTGDCDRASPFPCSHVSGPVKYGKRQNVRLLKMELSEDENPCNT